MDLQINRVFNLHHLNYVTPHYDYLDAFFVDEYINEFNQRFNQLPDSPFYHRPEYKGVKQIGIIIKDIHLIISSDFIINWMTEMCDAVSLDIAESELIMIFDNDRFKINATANLKAKE